MKKFYAVINLLVVLGLIYWNYYININGINGNTVSSLSDKYYTLFTPADYAFSIWGLIFLGLLGLCIYQIKKVFFDKKEDYFVLLAGPYLLLANLGNALWLDLWLNEMTGTSVFIMFGILISLLMIIFRLNMQLVKPPRTLKIWVWWPIALYSGWIAVATIANVAAYLSKIEWQVMFSEVAWTIIMILVATFVNLLMIQKRNMPVFALVGIWAFIAIAVRHWDNISAIQYTALGSAIVLAVSILQNRFRVSKI